MHEFFITIIVLAHSIQEQLKTGLFMCDLVKFKGAIIGYMIFYVIRHKIKQISYVFPLSNFLFPLKVIA